MPPLERVCSRIGCPRTIRVDQGSEFISRDMDLWAHRYGGTLDSSWRDQPVFSTGLDLSRGRQFVVKSVVRSARRVYRQLWGDAGTPGGMVSGTGIGASVVSTVVLLGRFETAALFGTL